MLVDEDEEANSMAEVGKESFIKYTIEEGMQTGEGHRLTTHDLWRRPTFASEHSQEGIVVDKPGVSPGRSVDSRGSMTRSDGSMALRHKGNELTNGRDTNCFSAS